jgi:transcriptional regulator with XRE-family HTH domain
VSKFARGLDGLPQRIATVRRKLGLPRARFAQRIGVSRNVVIRYEGGRNGPRAETLDRIAKLGGVTDEWVLGGGRRERAPAGEDRQWEGRGRGPPRAVAGPGAAARRAPAATSIGIADGADGADS